MMGTWIVLGVLVIGVVMALLTVRKSIKGGGCPGRSEERRVGKECRL